jgi:hypothetical protein
MKKSILLGVLSLSIVLSSCAIGIRKYVEPKEGAVATIKFTNIGVGTSFVEFFKGYETCKSRERGEPIPSNQSRMLKVRSGSPISFSFGYNIDSHKFCKVYGTFTPIDNASYQAEISPTSEGCILKFDKLMEDKSAVRDSSFKQREAIKNPFNEDSSFCK